MRQKKEQSQRRKGRLGLLGEEARAATARGILYVLGGLRGMTEELGREEELAMLMLELRVWRYSGGMVAMGRDERRRWVEEEEEETDEARRLV